MGRPGYADGGSRDHGLCEWEGDDGLDFTFYRGAALNMAADLSATPVSGLRVQACGPSLRAPPVIFITAHDNQATRARAASLGAAGYLAKPFPGRSLLDELRRLTLEENA